MSRSLTFGFLALVLGIAGASARPLTSAEGRYWPFSGDIPACQDEGVLERIQARFSERERKYWNSGLLIERIVEAREYGYRTAGVDLIPKRYCQAKAWMNDGKVRHVTYRIDENQGMIGFGWGVEWCIQGLDHHRAFGANCKAAGP